MFPQDPHYVINVYNDISNFYCLVNNALSVTGSYLYEVKKKELFRKTNDIILLANSFASIHLVPMKLVRPNQWDRPLSDLDSERIREIRYYCQVCISTYWNHLEGVDCRLKDMITGFQDLLQKHLDELSMRPCLMKFLNAYPQKLSTADNRNKVSAYLLVSELEYELRQTYFYHVFPSLLHLAVGVSLGTISDMLYNELAFLQVCPGFASFIRQLTFGNGHLLNISLGKTIYVVDSYLDDVIRILSHIKAVTNDRNVTYINQFMNSIFNLQNRIRNTPYVQNEIGLIREYFSFTSDLYNIQRMDRESARALLKRLGVILDYFNKNVIYRDLAIEMGKNISRLLSLYERKYICLFT